MKTIAAIIIALMCGLSFHAGVLHARGELAPRVEGRLRAARDWVYSRLGLK